MATFNSEKYILTVFPTRKLNWLLCTNRQLCHINILHYIIIKICFIYKSLPLFSKYFEDKGSIYILISSEPNRRLPAKQYT